MNILIERIDHTERMKHCNVEYLLGDRNLLHLSGM